MQHQPLFFGNMLQRIVQDNQVVRLCVAVIENVRTDKRPFQPPFGEKCLCGFDLRFMNIYSCYRGPLCRKNGKNAAKAATDLHYPAVTAEFQGCVLFNVREIIVPAGSCCFFKVGGTILMACLHGGNLKKQRRRIRFSALSVKITVRKVLMTK